MPELAAYNYNEADGSDALDVTGNGHDFAVGAAFGNSVRTASGDGHTLRGLTQSTADTVPGPPVFGQTANRTIMMWVRRSAGAPAAGWAWIWNVSSISSGAWGILFLSGQWHIQGRDAGGFARASVAAPPDDTWAHIAGTYDGTNIRLYLNGVLAATTALAGPLRSDADGLFPLLTTGSQTRIDETRIWDEVLTGAEIAALAAVEPPEGAGVEITVSNITVTPGLDVPVLSQVSGLAVADITVAPLLDVPDLEQASELTVTDIVMAPQLDTPELAQVSPLAVADIVVQPGLDSPVLEAASALTVADIVVAPKLDVPELVVPPEPGQPVLTVRDIVVQPVLSLPGLTSDGEETTVPDCWPLDTSCCTEWNDFPPTVQNRAAALAVQTLRMLTGYRVAGCPVTLRPCKRNCHGRTWNVYPVTRQGSTASLGSGYSPYIGLDGEWYNVGCACGGDDCSCTTVCEIPLPGQGIGSVTRVELDGVALDPSAYRVDRVNGAYRLVRQDGECWPLCQDMGKPLGQVGTFGVTYQPGVRPDSLAGYAAGVLACEYAKACTGKACRLPAGVQTVARQGVTLDLSKQSRKAAAVFPNNRTGIREVDDWVSRWNPHGLAGPSAVWSPDSGPGRAGRTTVWQAP